MRLFWDCETSGLAREDLPPEHPSQPNMVQLGAKLFDAQWRCTGSIVLLIKPAGWSIEPEAERHHGISEARCSRHGVPIVAALAAFAGLAANARQLIAHNVEFDRRIVRAEIERANGSGLWWQKKADQFFCTMEGSTPVTQLPGQWGSFKYPSLEEAHRHFFPAEPFETQHDAEEDLNASVRIFRELQALGLTPEPASIGRRP